MNQPSIDILGISIGEPVTFTTDLLITLVCFYACYRLQQKNNNGEAQSYFKYYFLFLGCSTFFAGLFGHAFQETLGPAWKMPGWLFSMFAVSAFEGMSFSHAKEVLPPALKQLFPIGIVVQLLVFLGLLVYTADFHYVVVHSTISLALIGLLLHAYVCWNNRSIGSQWVVAGILVTAISSYVFANQISYGLWFNHMDISHVVIALGTWVFMMGAERL